MADTIWIHRCKSMVRISFEYMKDMEDCMVHAIILYDPEYEGPDTLLNYVENYVQARDEWHRWKQNLLDEYRRL